MPLKNVVRFSCGVLSTAIGTCAGSGLTFPNADSPVSIMYETRNIPLDSIVPRNTKADADEVLAIITDAMKDSGFNTNVDVCKQRKIESWQLPYAVLRKDTKGRIVLDTDDIHFLQQKWAEITQKAEAIAHDRDLRRDDRPLV